VLVTTEIERLRAELLQLWAQKQAREAKARSEAEANQALAEMAKKRAIRDELQREYVKAHNKLVKQRAKSWA
jgi:hypothetical protein